MVRTILKKGGAKVVAGFQGRESSNDLSVATRRVEGVTVKWREGVARNESLKSQKKDRAMRVPDGASHSGKLHQKRTRGLSQGAPARRVGRSAN